MDPCEGGLPHGLVGYAFTAGASADGTGCSFEMTYNMEDAVGRALGVSLKDTDGDPSSSSCGRAGEI